MDQISVFATSSVPKKNKKRKSKANLGRHAGRRKQKAQREGAIVASFSSSCNSSPSYSITIQESGVTSSAFQIDLPREKLLRNAADYAKRKCAKK